MFKTYLLNQWYVLEERRLEQFYSRRAEISGRYTYAETAYMMR